MPNNTGTSGTTNFLNCRVWNAMKRWTRWTVEVEFINYYRNNFNFCGGSLAEMYVVCNFVFHFQFPTKRYYIQYFCNRTYCVDESCYHGSMCEPELPSSCMTVANRHVFDIIFCLHCPISNQIGCEALRLVRL